ncbi:MAG TPA: ABC transporter permease subunit [Dehalococcoidia bacterium]|nr:ABC transporter permease subunit [Dehalococcoidia bacterium]
MSRRHIQNILLKEWALLFTDLNSALIVTLLPLLIVGQGILYIWLASRFAGASMLTTPVFQTALQKLVEAIPGVAQLPNKEQILVLLLNQFNFFLLLIPTMIAINVATFSIVDEKLSGSLEALLATPVKTWELLLGKALAGAIPALVMTWLSAGVFLLVVSGLGWGDLSGFVVTAGWFLILFLLTPAVAILSFMLGVTGSSRAKDARGAQNVVLIIILPVLALIGIQITGILWFTPSLILVLALAIGIADFISLRAAVRLFRRESIVVQWR